MGAHDVDCDRFDALVDAATSASDDRDAVAQLDEALALWQGEPFGDQRDLEGVRAEAARLAERRRAAAEARLVALHRAGRHEDAVATAEALVAEEPLREGAWAVLVEALGACARPAEALRAFQRAAAVLAEAGLQPSPRLRTAEQAVLDMEHVASRVATTRVERATPPSAVDRPAIVTPAGVGAVARAPAAVASAAVASAADAAAADPLGSGALGAASSRDSSAAAPRRGVPQRYTSSFVGRDDDCARVAALLAQAPVVTLVGPGGVGKTRLAFEVAATIAGAGSDGCHIVELARLRDPSSVPAAVAAGLGLTMTGATPREALDHAGRLDLLLVLDNAEHVLDAVSDVVEHLIAVGGPLRVLVTSRERLGIDGEQLWPVAPLPTHGAASPARRLFVERARATLPHLPLHEDDPDVGRIVERLDGLPLALEMAAAQLRTISVADLADALDERLTVLRSPRRTAHERHRDIRSLLEWSEQAERASSDDARRARRVRRSGDGHRRQRRARA